MTMTFNRTLNYESPTRWESPTDWDEKEKSERFFPYWMTMAYLSIIKTRFSNY